MDWKRAIQIGLAVLLVLAAAGSAAASTTASILAFQMERHVIASGGGRVAQGDYVLNYTFGQPVAVVVGAPPHYGACAGFWCGGQIIKDVYLPTVLRNG